MMVKLIKRSAVALLILLLLLFIMIKDVQQGQKHYTETHPAWETPVYNGNISLYKKGQTLFSALFQDIKEAKSSVYLHFYILRNDALTKRLFSLLKEKASQGLNVYLSVDLIGGHELTRESIEQLKKSGVKVSFSRKISAAHPFYSAHHRNHRRIAVIDSSIGYVGGFNVGEEYLGHEKKLGKWHDYHIRITGEGINTLEEQFLLDWREDSKESIPSSSSHNIIKGGESSYRFLFTSGSGLENRMKKWIKEANSSLFVATPYFLPPRSIMDELEQALKRGVHVTILVPEKTDARLFARPPSYQKLKILVDKGADVYVYNHGFFHGKVLVKDEEFVDIGTANGDSRSFFLNDESNCIIYDKQFIQKMKNSLTKDIEKSKHVDQSYFESLPFWNKWSQNVPEFLQYYF
ncbi:phospholipase D-like domain-containing protein [Priestia endophytica]|uniref:phospholipase D-like domain-containing protein n=2 Tax=Priestia endophytica TaxID=135735 RepID=UPI003D297BC5